MHLADIECNPDLIGPPHPACTDVTWQPPKVPAIPETNSNATTAIPHPPKIDIKWLLLAALAIAVVYYIKSN